jgi:3-oxoacyl-[acyl-carrier protein] reductase
MIRADLSGKKALVTGGASGIGFGAVGMFARMGATVAVNDLPDNPQLDKAVADLRAEGLEVLAAPADLSDPDATREMVERAAKEMGGLDYLINNAGTPNTTRPIPPSDLDAMDEPFWDLLLSVNLRGPFRCTHAAAPFLKAANGAVVNTASVAAFGGGGSSSVYCVTKAGLVSLTRELARALAPEVRVNAIAPGDVNSDWMCRFDETGGNSQFERVPLRRIGEPEDYAEVMLFLCAGAGYVTGQTIIVDGGLTL